MKLFSARMRSGLSDRNTAFASMKMLDTKVHTLTFLHHDAREQGDRDGMDTYRTQLQELFAARLALQTEISGKESAKVTPPRIARAEKGLPFAQA